MDFAKLTRSVRRAAGLGIAALCMSVPAHADWTGKGEGGLLLSRGNADSTAGNGKLDIAKEQNDWKN